MVRDLGHRLGLSGTVTTLGPGVYELHDQPNGRLFVAHGRVVYSRAGSRAAATGLDDGRAGELARAWLSARQLLPRDAGPPRTRLVPETGQVIVTFVPDVPRPLITPEPSITVVLDGAGEVREIDTLWPASQAVSAYPLAGLGAAWATVRQGDGFVELDADLPVGATQRVAGQAHLTSARIGYALAAGTDANEAAFLEPVYIFAGTVKLADRPNAVACQVYVPALRDYPWPRG
jgi:hypothetical protein